MPRLLAIIVFAATAVLFAEDTAKHKDQAAQQERLAKVQRLVGSWRGVGQPQRSSTKDSWTEDAEWVWSFGVDGPALVASLPQGKYLRTLKLRAGDAKDQFELLATPAGGGEEILYRGQLDDQGQLVCNSMAPIDHLPRRLSFRFVAGGDRLLLLMEREIGQTGNLARIAEVGYTRQGSGFGKTSTQRECIVTGGLGTIEVSHDGKTYFVCCTGCRDYFNEDPKKVLAEYTARKDAEKKK